MDSHLEWYLSMLSADSIFPAEMRCPLEGDISLAQEHLKNLMLQVGEASGGEKESLIRQVNSLEERIRRRRQHSRAVGAWKIGTVYYTECAEQVVGLRRIHRGATR